MSGSTRSNRRKHRRLKGKGLSARLRSANGSLLCMVVNLSLGGAFVRSTRLLPLGTALTVELLGGMAVPVARLKGYVVNILDVPQANARGMFSGMGIKFEQTTKEAVDQLRELYPSGTGAIPTGAPPDEGGRFALRPNGKSTSASRVDAETESGES